MASDALDADIIFMTGLSGAGKTTTGDYLAEYCGLHHIDGDNIMQRAAIDRPEWIQVATDMTNAFYTHWLRKEPCPEGMWQPYMEILCSQVHESLRDHNPIVVTFAIYRREVRDFLREKLGRQLRFVRLDCDTDVLVAGALARLMDMLKHGGLTVEDWWKSDHPLNCGGQKKYGDFSLESFKQMQLENNLSGMVDFEGDELDAQVVDVTSKDSAAFHRVSAALGVSPHSQEVDIDKLKAITTEKMMRLAAAATPTPGSSGAQEAASTT